MRDKLKQIDSALAACRSMQVDVDLAHLEKSLKVKRQLTKELQFCDEMLNSMKKPIEDLYKNKGEESVRSGVQGEEIIKREYVAPIGGNTLPPRKGTPPTEKTPRKDRSPRKLTGPEEGSLPRQELSPIRSSPGKVRPDSQERHLERQNALDAVRQLTNVTHPNSLQGLAYSQIKHIQYSIGDKIKHKRKMTDASSSRFLRRRNLEWDYQGLRLQEYGKQGDGSYIAGWNYPQPETPTGIKHVRKNKKRKCKRAR